MLSDTFNSIFAEEPLSFPLSLSVSAIILFCWIGLQVLISGLTGISLAPYFLFLTPLFLILAVILRRMPNIAGAFFMTFCLGGVLLFLQIEPVLNHKPFSTYSSLKAFTDDLLSEKVEMENQNLLKPQYDKYYYKHLPSGLNERLHAILASIGLAKAPEWSVKNFVDLLEDVLEQQEEQKLPQKDYIVKQSLTDKSRIVVMGDLQGTFDSLTRNCGQMKELGILDENLKIVSPEDRIVLMGDAVSRSPYQLEHLSLIFRLILNNPGQVFYIRGNHESDNYWQEFNLKSELDIRVGDAIGSDDAIPLEKEMNTFFKALASGIYFWLPGFKEPAFLRISHYGADRSPLFTKESENKFYKFLSKPAVAEKLETETFHEVRDNDSTEKILLKAVIKGEKKRESYQNMDGMRLLSPEGGVTAWTIMSCPGEVYQKGLKFYYDAFLVLSFAGKPEDFKITLYKQDVRSKDGYKKREAELLTGKGGGNPGADPVKAEDNKKKEETSRDKEDVAEKEKKTEQTNEKKEGVEKPEATDIDGEKPKEEKSKNETVSKESSTKEKEESLEEVVQKSGEPEPSDKSDKKEKKPQAKEAVENEDDAELPETKKAVEEKSNETEDSEEDDKEEDSDEDPEEE